MNRMDGMDDMGEDWGAEEVDTDKNYGSFWYKLGQNWAVLLLASVLLAFGALVAAYFLPRFWPEEDERVSLDIEIVCIEGIPGVDSLVIGLPELSVLQESDSEGGDQNHWKHLTISPGGPEFEHADPADTTIDLFQLDDTAIVADSSDLTPGMVGRLRLVFPDKPAPQLTIGERQVAGQLRSRSIELDLGLEIGTKCVGRARVVLELSQTVITPASPPEVVIGARIGESSVRCWIGTLSRGGGHGVAVPGSQ